MQKRSLAALLAAVLLLTAGSAAAQPVPGTGTCGKACCYWETPMDITDTEAVWNMLIQPMVVVDGWQKSQVPVYSEPDEDSDPVGVVTCESQGLHVLEQLENGWSLVECYSSANSRSRIKVFGDLIRGYIPTDTLITVETRTRYALVVDKLTQRMYVFENGSLLTTLRISTGEINQRRPQYETNAGEFHLVSMVGSFVDEGIVSEYAIRFNDGDLIHSVPYRVLSDGTKYYRDYELLLGTPVSKGCIRVQRRLSPEGINMQWLWNHLFDQKQSRLAIWEACPGRQLSIPADDTPIYVRPDVSTAYHTSPECYTVNKRYRPLDEITYGQLEEEAYASLTDCPSCNPPLRRQKLEEINRQYALPGE
ncbi:MAG: L,D-transpeptidase [Clostridiales bacterium]|nr:L,D-transpeptidase [Clostridiales bacterium]